MKIEVTYDPLIKRYIAAVYNDGGAKVYQAIKSKRDSAKWAADNYVAYREPSA